MRHSPFVFALALGAGLIAAAPSAEAFPFGRNRDRAEQRPAAAATPPARTGLTPAIRAPGEARSAAELEQDGAAAPPRPPAPKATPAERAAARTLDVLGQANFWLTELSKDATDLEAAHEASTALRRAGSHERAAEIAAVGLQTRADDGRLWRALGLALVAGRQGEPAVQALQRAIALVPGDASLHSALGAAYDLLERPQLAHAAYRDGLRIAPDDAAILTNYGLSQALAGDLPGAEATLRRAAAIPGAPVQARQNLALVVGLAGRFEESERIAAADLPPSLAAENVAYLRRMLNGGDSRWTRARGEGGE